MYLDCSNSTFARSTTIFLLRIVNEFRYNSVPPEDEVEMVPVHSTAASAVIPQSDEEANLTELMTSPMVHSSTDEDIAREEAAAMEYTPEQHNRAIVLKHLRHVYVSLWEDRQHVAVGDLSLSLEYGEVFGLLGPNGAGTLSLLVRYFFMLSRQKHHN